MKTRHDLTALLIGLRRAGVDFILVGGMAAVSQGVPTTTFDLDIVPTGDVENLSRLHAYLSSVHGRFRGRPQGQVLEPTLEDLAAGGHCLLMTDLGALDILGHIGEGLDFLRLVPDTHEIEIRGQHLRILTLEKLVELRRKSTREKDQLSVALWEETLRRKKK
jgi:hypothetical protein